jgi:subtilisin family serine protease|tara:strand:- start:5208 stop:6806 length:1599 start_codon:yes stop_codon:yes gene_type:complete
MLFKSYDTSFWSKLKMAKYIVAMDSTQFSNPVEARTAITDSGASVTVIYNLQFTYEIEATADQLAAISNVAHSSLAGADAGVELQALDTNHFRFLDNRAGRTLTFSSDADYRPKYKGDGVTVYLVDTGIDTTHPEFANSNVTAHSDVVTSGGQDLDGHGTAVASLIVGENLGIAKNAGLLSVKLFDSATGTTTIGQVIQALSDVKGHHDANDTDDVKVVCLPWTTPQNAFIDAKVLELNSANLVVVASAGNHNADINNYSPAGIEEIITVGSIDGAGNIASFTNLPFGTTPDNALNNYGAALDIFTIGETVCYAEVKSPDEDYMTGGGTSLSAGIVAGGVCSYIQKHSDKSSAQIKDVVISEGSTIGKEIIRVNADITSSININELNLSLLSLDAEGQSELFSEASGRIANIQYGAASSTVDLGLQAGSANVEVLSFSPLSPWMAFDTSTGVLTLDTTDSSTAPASISPAVYLFAVRGEVGGNVLVEEYSVGVYTTAVTEVDGADNFYYDTDSTSYDAVETTTYEGAVPSKN